MTRKFFNGGKVLLLAVALLATPVLAGSGSVTSSANTFPGLRALFPAYGSYTAAYQKGPRLSVEKSSYLAGESVEISGADFEPYERVRFAVGTQAKDGNSALVIGQWDVYADRKGSVHTTWDVPSQETFTITATGMLSGRTGKIDINPEAEAVNITQCANSNANPQNLDCPSGGPAGWVSGLVGNSKARYFEGDSIAYRNVMTGLTVGNSYKWTVKYDVTKGSLNAIDYLTTYNRTISNANPCRDGANLNAFCTFAGPTSTFAIPTDPKVTAGRDQTPATSDDITQIPGNITAWGGTITAVSVPSYPNTFPTGDLTATVDITFTASASTVVIAWGGHISTRQDWGAAFGSVNITGAPYHSSNGGLMNLTAGTNCCGGSQDLQLSAVAVSPEGRIVIYKHASPPTGLLSFNFTTTNLSVASFSLSDSVSDPGHTPGGANPHMPANAGDDPSRSISVTDFSNTKTVTESGSTPADAPYSLAAIRCAVTEDFDGNNNSSFVVASPSVNITLGEGDTVTCTFFNDFVTAVEAMVQGRVTVDGRPIGGAWVSATDGNGNTRFARTNVFGQYSIGELEAGTAIFVDVSHKSYTFPSRFVTLGNEVNNVDFNGTAR